MVSDINEGLSNDELIAIGTRKRGIDINISATDINRSIPFDLSKQAAAKLDGFTKEQLKNIAEKKINIPAMQPCEINEVRISTNIPDMIQNTLDHLQNFLGIRSK